MYTTFSNEKLGKMVEDVRLSEIRQQVDAQRFARENDSAAMQQPQWFNRLRAIFTVRRWRMQSPEVLRRATVK